MCAVKSVILIIYVHGTLLVIGVVLREQGSAVTEDQDRLLRVDQRFTSFTSWNLDKPPSADDKLNKAMQWIDIAKAVSMPNATIFVMLGVFFD